MESISHLIEGVFFLHGMNAISEDWCPLCKSWTRFLNPVSAEMNSFESRKLDCNHQITYVFLIEKVAGESVRVVRKRIR